MSLRNFVFKIGNIASKCSDFANRFTSLFYNLVLICNIVHSQGLTTQSCVSLGSQFSRQTKESTMKMILTSDHLFTIGV